MNLNPLTTRGFLFLGGVILIVLGLAGMVFLGPTSGASLLGEFFYLAPLENYAHLLLGLVALAAYFLLSDAKLLKYLVAAVGFLALLAALGGVLYSMGMLTDPNLAVLQNPADTGLHVLVGVWALAAAFMKK